MPGFFIATDWILFTKCNGVLHGPLTSRRTEIIEQEVRIRIKRLILGGFFVKYILHENTDPLVLGDVIPR